MLSLSKRLSVLFLQDFLRLEILKLESVVIQTLRAVGIRCHMTSSDKVVWW